MQPCRLLRAILTVLGCSFPLTTSAQHTGDPYTRRPIAAVKTTTPPTIDGDLSDPAWKEAPKATVFVDLQNGNVVADQTLAYILYDDKYIYVAFYARDSQPEKITARETIRDYKYGGDFDQLSEDSVEVAFDPFLNHRDRSLFSLNAIGTRSASLAGGRGSKREWQGDWDGAMKRVPDGWTAEMRIPWVSLNYPSSRQPTTIGINFARNQSRTRILSIWSNIGPKGFFEYDGFWTGVLVPAGAFHPKLSLLPYLLPGSHHADSAFRSGLDARYTITPELTAVGSINPDFGTIEGAVEGIQFSRTERFVPERRPFFLEGGDDFNFTNVNIIGTYFFSNRIRTFDVGTKLYGKLTPADSLGFLHTLDYSNRNDVVARYRHEFSATSSGGIFFTQKSAKDDNNTVGVLNQNTRWGKLMLDWKWAFSSGQSAGGGAQELAFVYLDKHFVWAIGGANISPIFRDANGFIGFTGYRGPIAQAVWSAEWRRGFWRSVNAICTPVYFWHTDGRPFQRGLFQTGFSLETRSDWRIGLDINYLKFDEQTDATIGLRLTSGVSNRFRQWGVFLQTGRQADRPYSFVGPEFSMRVFRRLDLAYGGAIQNFDGRAQQHILTINYELSPTRSFGGRIVVQDTDTNWYLSYRHSGIKGTETFFIIGDPNARRFVEQALVKFVFAL